MQKYSAMEIDLYHRGTVNGKIEFVYAEDNGIAMTVSRPMTETEGAPYTFKRYCVDLTELPAGTIKEMRFVFNVNDDQPLYYVNIAKIVLKP